MSGVWLKQTDLPLNGASEKEKERCDLGAMTERSGVFSAGATGVPITTTNIVLDESYKTMNQSALSSSPAQNQDHNATNNMYNTVTATSANININSIFPRDYSDFDYSQSGGESP